MESRASYTTVGAFFVLGVLVLSGALIWLIGQKTGFRQMAYYSVYFSGSVSGLREGSPVRYRGVPVGAVQSLGIDPENSERIEVVLAIYKNTPIKIDTQASLEMQGITGASCVQISGGSQDQPLLTKLANQKYPVIVSKVSRFEEVIDSAPEVIKGANEFLHSAERFLSPQNQLEVSRMFKNLADLTDSLARRRKDLEQLFERGHVTLDHASKTLTEIEKLASVSHDVLLEFKLMLQENRASVHNFTGIGLDQLTKLISDMRTGVLGLNRILDRVERSPSQFLFSDTNQGVSSR